MPEWGITLISIGASAIVSGVIGYLVKRTLDRYFKRKDTEAAAKEKELKEAEIALQEKRQKNLEETMDKVIKTHTEPIYNKVSDLDNRVAKIQNGTLDTLRDRILSSYYKCLEKGYRTQYDYENVHHMYDDYVELHGNSFVEDCMNKLDSLPSEEEYRILHKKKQNKTKKGGAANGK